MVKKNEEMFGFLPKVDANSPQGTIGRLKLSDLKPTQNAVGMDEVNAKVKKHKERSGLQLEEYLMPRVVPVIIGNGGKCYLIDHHHLTISLWLAKGDMEIPVMVTRNWSSIEGNRFWKAMAADHWVYPFDAMGAGPFNPATLKQHVKDLDNDIYRSLSWVVREQYGYVKESRQRDLRGVQVGQLLPHARDLQPATDQHQEESGRHDPRRHPEGRSGRLQREDPLRAVPGQFPGGCRPARFRWGPPVAASRLDQKAMPGIAFFTPAGARAGALALLSYGLPLAVAIPCVRISLSDFVTTCSKKA